MIGDNWFKKLSWASILFFLERTDFSEPSICGLGFASSVKEVLLEAAAVKAENDGVIMAILIDLKKKKGW